MFLDHGGSIVSGIVFSMLLIAIAQTDVRSRRVPNRLVLALIVTGGVAAVTALSDTVGAFGTIAGAGLGLAIWLPLWLGRVLGAGDVKLAAAIGAWLGPAGIVEASVLAALAGGALAAMMLVRRRRVAAVASGVALWTMALQRGELTRPLVDDRQALVPYGVALAIGAALTGWMPTDWFTL